MDIDKLIDEIKIDEPKNNEEENIKKVEEKTTKKK
jgi:hypothetical protein